MFVIDLPDTMPGKGYFIKRTFNRLGHVVTGGIRGFLRVTILENIKGFIAYRRDMSGQEGDVRLTQERLAGWRPMEEKD